MKSYVNRVEKVLFPNHFLEDFMKERSQIQESLVKLYFRLNGYFSSGFIVHSDEHGKNKTEVDVLAIRLPYNSEPERGVPPSPFLPLKENHTNLAICEVKSKGQQLQFNDTMHSQPDTIVSILRWVGLFKNDEINSLATELARAMQPANSKQDSITIINGPRNSIIYPLLSCPEKLNKRDNQPFYLHGKEIFQYIYDCFCPRSNRECCATKYDFTAWGKEFFPIVDYFKKRSLNDGPGTMKKLYNHLNV
ncbi:hypothetical protein [Desulfobacter postgatei]|uniref:hypothetical protein n=1 Tax=Desulfobacter postgatei TaxID=2293 RepID=UPI00259BC2F2|nr:hypothetical protein [uncultured Desulfobacter sp.]